MKHLYIGLFLLPSLFFAQSNNYYSGTENLSGYHLKSKLHDIITNKTISWHYGDLPAIYATTDVDRYYENNGSLLDIYSEIPTGPDAYEYNFSQLISTANAEGLGYNREHAVPQSTFNSSYPMYSDLFFVIPTDARINQLRSNYPYGIVGNASYTFSNGSRQGTNAIPNSPYAERAYEPIDEFKGDVARMLLYYVVRYEGKLSSFNFNSNALPSKDRNPMDGTEERGFEQWYLDMLLSWHNLDPVSQREIDRNNYIYQVQNNRNPFIDHPEWVANIWAQTITSTAPPVVNNFKISKNSAYFTTLDWDASVDPDVIGYEVYQNGNLIATTKYNSYTADRLMPSTDYNYNVVAYNNSYIKSPNSPILAVTTLSNDLYANDLFISKFISGTDSNKAIEITNKTGHTVDLQGYRISTQNKSATNYYYEYPLEFEGKLEHGKSIVVINPSSQLPCYSAADGDFQSAAPAVAFDGTYYFELNYKNKTVDAIGAKSQNNNNKNQSLYRLPDITNPNATFTASEWNFYPANFCQNLGSLTNQDFQMVGKIKIYPNPVSDILYIKSDKNISHFQVFDASGRVLKSGILNQKTANINVSDLAVGTYFLKLDQENYQIIKK